MRRFFAYIDPHADRLMRYARLHVAEERGNGKHAVLLEDGSWQELDENVASPINAGITIPQGALEALAEALQKHLGNALPSQAEVAILREVLKKEQERVDTLFNATVTSIHGVTS